MARLQMTLETAVNEQLLPGASTHTCSCAKTTLKGWLEKEWEQNSYSTQWLDEVEMVRK